VEKYGRARLSIDDNLVRRMRFACWITKPGIQTHSEYVIHNAFLRQQRLREGPSMLRYTYTACLVRMHEVPMFDSPHGSHCFF
jgi:hypothetical protein